MSAGFASTASASSGPSVSNVTFAPLPAASIITPMMLFALTLRLLRDITTSHWYFAASCVSFAEARACNPSLLTISTSRCGIGRVCLHVQHAFAAARNRLLDHGSHAPATVGDRAHEHWQIDAGDALDTARLQQFADEIAGRRAIDVGEDQDTR